VEHGRPTFGAGEVLLDVAGERAVVGERGQDVDEAEEARLETLIPHRPLHRLAGPEAAIEETRLAVADGLEDLQP
jgi:hypothetical protein